MNRNQLIALTEELFIRTGRRFAIDLTHPDNVQLVDCQSSEIDLYAGGEILTNALAWFVSCEGCALVFRTSGSECNFDLLVRTTEVEDAHDLQNELDEWQPSDALLVRGEG